ncbi:MAG: hypothetical protein J6J36_05350 [Clostridia bacterium]|nr:hypothetical protein [Clostridia bacterium]
MTEIYRNAFQEVYVIINNTERDVYLKIPKDVLNMIEEQRNVNHTFCYSNDFENLKASLLPETKAILFSFLMDYLSTPEQRAGIIKLQEKENLRRDYKKSMKYSVDVFDKKNISLSNQNIDDDINNTANKDNKLIKYQGNFLRKVWNKIIFFFRKK